MPLENLHDPTRTECSPWQRWPRTQVGSQAASRAQRGGAALCNAAQSRNHLQQTRQTGTVTTDREWAAEGIVIHRVLT